MVFEKDGRCRGTEREAVGLCRWSRIGCPPLAVLASGQGTTYSSVSPVKTVMRGEALMDSGLGPEARG